jgi:co-chaperonin GroES (HSP10)
MNIQPLGNRVLIEQIDQNQDTTGIITSGNPNQGQIVAVGEGSKLKVGDIVYFLAPLLFEIEYDNKKYLIAKEDDIFAKII